MNNIILGLLIGLPIVSGVGGYFARKFIVRRQIKSLEAKAQKIIDDAKIKEKEILIEVKDESIKIKDEAKKEIDEKQNYLLDLEKNLRKKEETLDRRVDNIEVVRGQLSERIKKIDGLKRNLSEAQQDQMRMLEKISKISRDEAKKILMEMIEKEHKEEIVKKIKEIERETHEQADIQANKIIALAVQRLASEKTAESTVETVSIPTDEMKGRIIGREGRNIQAFEKEAGVDIIIDDTPEAVVISCFDPIRRQVAKIALQNLIVDGRIHPARIEEQIQKAKEQIAQEIKEAGEHSAYEVGVAGLHPDLLKILGRLKYRTSYGQNVLKHSIEVAHIAGMLAAELGADVAVSKKAGLLHDIGKAVDHDVPGSHAIISRDIAKKYGLLPDVIHAIESHHDDVEQQSIEAIIVDAADAISGSRPGARRETMESYIKRLQDLENVANSFPGVEKSYAIQAGREVRIIVQPEDIDDLAAIKLSSDIAKKIEKDIEYPGQIKVNVIRETRAIDFAK